MKVIDRFISSLLAVALLPAGAVLADQVSIDAQTLELCAETQHELNGLLAELERSQARLAQRRTDIDQSEARLLEIKTVVEDPDAGISDAELADLVREFNALNANRSAQVPAYQDDRDYVGNLIDQYNALTDSYNAQCGDVAYVAEELTEICERRPELADTRWCARAP